MNLLVKNLFSKTSQSEVLKYLGLFVCYFVTAKVGLSIGSLNKFATLIWPPTGIALVFLLIFGVRFWPSIFLAAFLINYTTGASLPVALGISFGNTAEAWVAFQLCQSRKSGFHCSLDRLDDVITLIFQCAVMSTLVSAIIGVMSLWVGGTIHGPQLVETFFHWWAGDAMGDLIVAPLLLTTLSVQKVDRFTWKQGRLADKIFLMTVAVVVSWVILSSVFKNELRPFLGLKGIYILIPILLWVSMRFGQRGAAIFTFFISALALSYTLVDKGAFADGLLMPNLLHLVIFLAIVAGTGLFVGAVATERETERTNLEQRTKELQESETQLKRTRDIAEEASAAKSAFLANMSHEIRTPLGAVLGFSELLLQPDLTASDRANSADAIRRNGRLLSNIVNDILDLSKVEAGKLEIEMSEVTLHEIMTDFSSLLSLEANAKGVQLRVFSEGALPNTIRTDALRIRQILLNIVGNAIKFTDQGSVEVTVKLVHTANMKPQLVFRVRDTGRGISPTQVSRLFAPFSQADASTTRKFGGTGLGLILSKRLAQTLGGDVKMTESQLGIGSTFTITIDPGEIGSISIQDFAPKKESQQRSIATAPHIPLQLAGLNILVVDDSYDNQILITRLLQKAKISVETAQNGKEAIEKAQNHGFDAILMDLQMPVMDGYEATRILRQSGMMIPIIALTAHAMKDERRKCLDNGFSEHICKPIDYEVLLNTLASHTTH